MVKKGICLGVLWFVWIIPFLKGFSGVAAGLKSAANSNQQAPAETPAEDAAAPEATEATEA